MTEPASPFDPLKAVWLSQPVEPTRMTAADLTAGAAGFEGKVRRRNLIEYAAGAVVILFFGAGALFGHFGWMMRSGMGLGVLGVAFILWQLHRRGRPGQTPAGGSAESLLIFQRTELARQRDALKSVPLWYLAPVVPSFVMTMLGRWLQDPVRGRGVQEDHAMILTGAVIALLLFVIVWLLNALGAAKLDRAIDRIDLLRRK
jgi:hypothetical protein